MRGALALMLIAGALTWHLPARAAEAPDKEEVQFDVSTREISIKSNFTGIEIVVFGSIDNARPRLPGQTPYDVVIVISGPKQALAVWRKQRVAGIWVNGASESFVSVPSFYAVLSTRQIDTITSPETLKTLGIGTANLRLGGGGVAEVASAEDVFRAELVRIKTERDLFQQTEGTVNFIGRSLFRGKVTLPVNVPLGRYMAQVYLFRDGQLLSQNESHLQVRKAGFERFVYLLAFRYPFIYGLVAVVMAVLLGGAAWAAFRRE
jgi:uncharacterized protein (TIGR02186 family)